MMMKLSRVIVPINDPLLVVEDVVDKKGWIYLRPSDAEMSLTRQGSWSAYHLYFAWLEELRVMQFCSVYDFSLQNARTSDLHVLISLLNERMWLGHFEVDSQEQTVLFRHNMRVMDYDQNLDQQIDDLIHIAIEQCERFYPAFQFVLWGGKSPYEAVEACLMDVVGHA